MKQAITGAVLSLVFLVPSFSYAAFDTNLKYGSTGSKVTELQEFLTDQGVYSGPVSGNFYSLTRAAVKAYQLKNNVIPTSGFWGPLTRKIAQVALDEQDAASNGAEVKETGTTTPATGGETVAPIVQRVVQPIVQPAPIVSTPAPVVATPTPVVEVPGPNHDLVGANGDGTLSTIPLRYDPEANLIYDGSTNEAVYTGNIASVDANWNIRVLDSVTQESLPATVKIVSTVLSGNTATQHLALTLPKSSNPLNVNVYAQFRYRGTLILSMGNVFNFDALGNFVSAAH